MNANIQEIALQPINYVPAVTLYSQWRSKTGARKFLIVRIHYDFPDDKCEGAPRPTELEVLDFTAEAPFSIPWNDFIKLVDAGEMVKNITNQS